MKCIYGPSDLDSVADMSELSVHFAAYDRDELNMSFTTHDLKVAVDMTDITPRWTTKFNKSEWYRTATVRLMDSDNKYGMRYTRCVAFSLVFWFSKYNMVSGITYLPYSTEWWKDSRRNSPENILTAAESIYRIILLLLFAGNDLKLADLLGISIYGEDNFFIGGGIARDSEASQDKKPWFLEDWTEDL